MIPFSKKEEIKVRRYCNSIFGKFSKNPKELSSFYWGLSLEEKTFVLINKLTYPRQSLKSDYKFENVPNGIKNLILAHSL